jgi:hypothetical protein
MADSMIANKPDFAVLTLPPIRNEQRTADVRMRGMSYVSDQPG